jgi:hypothetical protein
MLPKSSLRPKAVIACVADEMIHGRDPVLTTLLIGIKIPPTGEAIVMISILTEMVQ